MRLVFGQDAFVAQWAIDKYDCGLPACTHALGVVDAAGNIRGAATLHYYGGSNIELCYWGPLTLTRGIVREIVEFCFYGLKVSRITARTQRNNKVMVRHLTKLGVKFEGVARHYYGSTKKNDAILFGLTFDDAARILRRP
jgi:RimJ/RimL family protein N-acetyltransferase